MSRLNRPGLKYILTFIGWLDPFDDGIEIAFFNTERPLNRGDVMKYHLLLIFAVLILYSEVCAQEENQMLYTQSSAPSQNRGLAQKLKLSDEQRMVIQQKRLEMKKEIIPLSSDLIRLNMEKKLAISAKIPNRDQIMQIVQEMSETHKKIEITRIDHQLKVRSMLNDEQKLIFDQFMLSSFREKKSFYQQDPRLQRKRQRFQQNRQAPFF